MRQPWGIAAGVAILLLASSGALFADTFGASCNGANASVKLTTQDASGLVTDTSVNDAGPCGASTQNSSTVTVIEDDQFFPFLQNGSASASARASLGILGARASADASSTPESYTFTNANGVAESVDDSAFAVAGAGASAMWFDTFTNPNPDTIELELFSVFHSSTNGIGIGGASGQTTAIFQVGCSSSPFSFFGTCDSFIPIGNGTIVWLDPGAVMQVTAQISAQATAASGLISCGVLGQCVIGGPPPSYFPPESFTADAFNTLGFYIDVVGGCNLFACNIPGQTYDTGSGHIYSLDALNAATNPTPEPSSLLLFGSGLAGLAAWGRKKLLAI